MNLRDEKIGVTSASPFSHWLHSTSANLQILYIDP